VHTCVRVGLLACEDAGGRRAAASVITRAPHPLFRRRFVVVGPEPHPPPSSPRSRMSLLTGSVRGRPIQQCSWKTPTHSRRTNALVRRHGVGSVRARMRSLGRRGILGSAIGTAAVADAALRVRPPPHQVPARCGARAAGASGSTPLWRPPAMPVGTTPPGVRDAMQQ